MKASDNILTHRSVNTAPLLRYVERLCFGLMNLAANGYYRRVEAAAQGVYVAVREMCRLELANEQCRLKFDMLSHKYWRRQVLRELGGERALARWTAAEARAILRRFGLDISPMNARLRTRVKKHQSPDDKPAQHPLIHHPLIHEESCRMDFEGEFRLPPLPRFNPKRPRAKTASPQAQPRPKLPAKSPAKSPAPIAATLIKTPIKIWPAEFHAAEAWDYACWLRKHHMNHRLIRAKKVKAKVKAKIKVTGKVASQTNPLETVLRHVPDPFRALLDITFKQDRAHEAAT